MSVPSYSKVKKSEHRMAWLMFQKIATIYCNIKKKDTNNSAILFKKHGKICKQTKIYKQILLTGKHKREPIFARDDEHPL